MLAAADTSHAFQPNRAEEDEEDVLSLGIKHLPQGKVFFCTKQNQHESLPFLKCFFTSDAMIARKILAPNASIFYFVLRPI